MDESTTKEKILKRVRDALISKKENPFKNIDFNSSVFVQTEEDIEIAFARKLMDMGGAFVYCENERALGESLKSLLSQKEWQDYFVVDQKLKMLLESLEVPFQDAPEAFNHMVAGITRCEYLIAVFWSLRDLIPAAGCLSFLNRISLWHTLRR